MLRKKKRKKGHAGSFLLLDHPPDVVDHQPGFVPADHLRLFPGVTPQLHRTKGTALRIDTTNSETGNQTMEKETSPGCTCIEGIFCSGRGTDRTRAGWTRKKEGISARTNLTDIYVLGGDPICHLCAYVSAADKVTVWPNASREEGISYCTLIPKLMDKDRKQH